MKLNVLLHGELSLKRAARYVIFFAACFLLYLAYLYFTADNVIFVPPPSSYGSGAEIIRIATDDGGQIPAFFLEGPHDSYTVLYSHGNAEDIGHIRPVLEEFRRQGFSVLAYDYRGYGMSGGSPSEVHAYQDVEAAYRYLVREMHIKPGKIIACGRSLGGTMAVYLACREPVGGLIVESGFVSAGSVMMHVRVPLIDKFDSGGRIGRVKCPVLIIHGRQDDIIPLWHGEELYRLAPRPKRSLWVEGAGHNDLMAVAGKRYWDTMHAFVRIVRHGYDNGVQDDRGACQLEYHDGVLGIPIGRRNVFIRT